MADFIIVNIIIIIIIILLMISTPLKEIQPFWKK